jgi:starvation-inducible outer membrane lipoprotein
MPHTSNPSLQRACVVAMLALLLTACAPPPALAPPQGVQPQLLLLRVDHERLTMIGRAFGAHGQVLAAATNTSSEATLLELLEWTPERVEAALPAELSAGWIWLVTDHGTSVRFPYRRR